jgi:hypothetical protein
VAILLATAAPKFSVPKMHIVRFTWPPGIRMFDVIPVAEAGGYNKQPGIAVFISKSADGSETVLHVREYDNFASHVNSVMRFPQIKHRENVYVLASETPKPAQELGLQAFQDWFTGVKTEVLKAKQVLKPVVND